MNGILRIILHSTTSFQPNIWFGIHHCQLLLNFLQLPFGMENWSPFGINIPVFTLALNILDLWTEKNINYKQAPTYSIMSGTWPTELHNWTQRVIDHPTCFLLERCHLCCWRPLRSRNNYAVTVNRNLMGHSSSLFDEKTSDSWDKRHRIRIQSLVSPQLTLLCICKGKAEKMFIHNSISNFYI